MSGNNKKAKASKVGIPYFDGIAVSILVYLLSPDTDKLRNVLVIGGLHMLLHDTACKYKNEKQQLFLNSMSNTVTAQRAAGIASVTFL